MKKFLIPIGIFALLGYLLYYGLRLDPRKIPSPLVGKPLPAFSLPSLDNPDRLLTNADLRGRVVMINIWASWCAACKQEHPLLLDVARNKQVSIVGLNYKDAPADALNVLRQEGNPYDQVIVDASGRTGIDWGVYGVPESFILDKQGIIRYKHIGPITPDAWNTTLLPLIRRLY